MKIAIAGAAGFIGSNLASHILQNTSHTVITIDDLSTTQDLDNLQFALGHKNERHRFYSGGIESEVIRKILSFEKPDIVVDVCSHKYTYSSRNAIWNCGMLGVQKYICLSSIEIDPSTVNENLQIIEIETSEVFGPRQRADKLMPMLFKKALGITDSFIKQDEIRLLYIKDLLDALLLIIEGNVQASRKMKIVSSTKCSVDEIFKFTKNIVDGSGTRLVKESVADETSKEITSAGWASKRPLEQMIEHTISWFNMNRWAFKND